ncbi:MAG: peptide ABC transporter substrate-binding protein, partial [Candidatus Izemoplasmatales bacterium]|nr:peptide ABC transporter substrate-binding protein [Candidatus Izemoplasmatales bacterium]
MKKVLSILMAVVMVVILAACQKPAQMVLNWNIGADPLTLDPTLNGASDGGNVINQTFEGLFREINGVVLPGIATSMDTSADGLTVTFNLRQSKWSDGSDLTAHDFIYSWKRGMDPATASEYSWIWEYTNVVGAIDAVYEGGSLDDVGIEAVDNYTLRVQLTHPTPYFDSLMSFFHFMPVKQSSVEHAEGADGIWAKKPALAVSNGPFKLTAYTPGAGLVLEKNDNYWNKDVVKISKIEGKFLDDETTAFAGYNSGSLDFIPSVPSGEVAGLIALKLDTEFFIFELLGTYYYNFNMTLPQFQNVKLRQALAYAINREAIVDALGAGQVPAVAFVPPGFKDHLQRDFFETAGSYGIATDASKYGEAVTLFAQAANELGLSVEALRLQLKNQEILYNTSGS